MRALLSSQARGLGIFTDELFTSEKFTAAGTKKTARVVGEGRIVELKILSAEITVKSGGRELLSFVVPDVIDAATKEFIIGRDIILL